jgi:copper chaperone
MLLLKVAGMTCQHCVQTIRQAIAVVAPHANTSVDLAAGTVDVSGPADVSRVIVAIHDEGYQASAT